MPSSDLASRMLISLALAGLAAGCGPIPAPSDLSQRDGGAADSGGDAGDRHDEQCTDEECGEAPGIPAEQCSDGSYTSLVCERSASGVCGWRYTECPDDTVDCNCTRGGYAPVCGVDGNTYDAICGEECVPVEIRCGGECPCTLACGDLVCSGETPVCYTFHPGTPEGTSTVECQALWPNCEDAADPDCSCFETSSSCSCREEPEDMFEVTCAAP